MTNSARGRLLLLIPPETPLDSFAVCRAQPNLLPEQLPESQRQLFGSFDWRPREQLGIGCLAAMLRQSGYEVRVVDCAAEMLGMFEAVEVISLYAPDWIGISISSPLQASGAEIIGQLVSKRRPHTHICVGGAAAVANYKELLRKLSFVSSAVVGEGEATVLELVRSLERGEDWRRVRGLASLEGEGVAYSPRLRHCDLGSIPFPERDTLKHFRRRGVNIPVVNMFSSRYCLAGCVECNGSLADVPGRAKHLRYRSAEDMTAELEMLFEQVNARRFYYVDEDFLGPESCDRVLEFAERVLSRGLNVELLIECPAEQVSREKIHALKRAGLRRVLLSLATANEEGPEWQEINGMALAICRESRLAVEPSMILFGETTTPEELREAGEFMRKHALHECRQPLFLLNRLQFFPGTRIEDALRYDIAANESEITTSRAPARCQDPVVDLIWRKLRLACVRLYGQSEVQFPFVAANIWQKARRSPPRQGDVSTRELFSKTRLWRAHIGDLFLDWIQVCLTVVDDRDHQLEALEYELTQAIQAATDGYDLRWLGVSFDQVARTAQAPCH